MKLSNLLEYHRKYANDGVVRSFGDGFLCAKNRIYRRARERAIHAGFIFSDKQNDAYRALPLSQLDQILRAKSIPYIDNVTVLEEIESKIPRATDWSEISDNLKGNNILHESCHAYAREQLKGLDASLGLLMEESYANTCELLTILDADDQVHRIFIELNSFVYMLDARVHLINAANEIGVEALFRYLFLSYLHANYLRQQVDFEGTLKLAVKKTIHPAMEKSLRQLSKIAFQLNPRFREVTTQFYFKLHGIQPRLDIDFLKVIESSKIARDFLERVF